MKILKYLFLLIIMCNNSIIFGQTQKILYSYDSQNRVKTVLFPNGNTETYYYDKVGNRTNQVNVVVGIKENKTIDGEFKVFPNLTDGFFNITGITTTVTDFTIKLFDNTGKEINSYILPNTNNFNQELNIKDLASGSYHLTLSTNQGSRTWAIIKI